MLKYFTRPLALVVMAGAILLTFGIIILMMSVVIFGQEPVLRGFSCHLALSEDCLRNDLREERQKIQELQRQQQELMAKIKEADALTARLSELDHASSSYVVFFNASVRGYAVTTGHTYASLLDPSTLIGAHCYTYGRVTGAGSRQVQLGKMSARKRITLEKYRSGQLRGSGLSTGDITALQAQCQWPEGAV